MRLNERNVAAFASAPTPIDKEGWLRKKGELNKGYQRRWFVLKGNLLFYFERQGDTEPVGVIVLEKCSVGLCDDGDPYSFYVAFEGQGARTYVLVADNEADMTSWIKSISHAGYDYLRMMVEELKRRLERLQAERGGMSDLCEEGETTAGAKGVRHSAPNLVPANVPELNALPRYRTVPQIDLQGSSPSPLSYDSRCTLQPVPSSAKRQVTGIGSQQSTKGASLPVASRDSATLDGFTRNLSERKNPFLGAVNRTQPSFISHTQQMTTTTTAGLEPYRVSNGSDIMVKKPDIVVKKPVRSFAEMHREFGVPIQHILDKQVDTNNIRSPYSAT